MFDIGFSELFVIGIVALIVIGPERLPKVARTAGLLFGRMQRYVSDIKADINREMQFDELKKLQEEMRASVSSVEQSVTQELDRSSQALHAAVEQIHEIVEIPRETASSESPPVLVDSAQDSEQSQQQLELSLETPVQPVSTDIPASKHV